MEELTLQGVHREDSFIYDSPASSMLKDFSCIFPIRKPLRLGDLLSGHPLLSRPFGSPLLPLYSCLLHRFPNRSRRLFLGVNDGYYLLYFLLFLCLPTRLIFFHYTSIVTDLMIL